MYTVNETYKNIEAEFKPRSKWDHGVKARRVSQYR